MATPSKVTLQRWLAGQKRGLDAGTLHRLGPTVRAPILSIASITNVNCKSLAGSAYPMSPIGINTLCSA